ncbi:CEL6 protein [Dendrothele bispora CBS 962.96]|uniref:CEL6 protein n=1 Tax=Dendrothele bispora (strain CBS 962.96) TaxID=1314807 RepID=A0A4S8KYP6_DENBC|nr:CEL6 protein [Dendrothele bispora CBS 962.96]
MTALTFFVTVAAITRLAWAVSLQAYNWKNVKIGGGGGFVSGIVFNPSEEGLAFARTDIGGAYRLNPDDDTWTAILDFAGNDEWNYWGVDAIATDPVDPDRLYLATGMYTNDWDPNKGQILISTDRGDSFTKSPLPFKVGGNMPGRGIFRGERLVVDPNMNSVLFFGARSGTYVPDPSDSSGYNSDKIGIAWITFDSTSGQKGSATPRIFVGVASNGTDNIFVSEDAGDSWTAVAGQNTQFFPHKGVLSPQEEALYVSYSDGAGPYDGTLGAVHKYDIEGGSWTDITPVSGSDLYFGFGGVGVDLKNPGTIMVAALNSWWPEGQIFRSLDGGATWKGLWEWGVYPEMIKHFAYDDSLAPWLGPDYTNTTAGTQQVGWMMESLVIDPFDSDHFLYGTGATIYGSRDLTKWDTAGNFTLESMADGVEETAVQGLIAPPGGPPLLSALGDIGGFVHNNLDTPRSAAYSNPTWSTTADIDFAGNKPTIIVRTGTGDASQGKQVALSSDSGATWSPHNGAADNVAGAKVAISADGDTVLWKTASSGIQVSKNLAQFTQVSSLSPSTSAIASDKLDNTIFYAASGSTFYISTDGGQSFKQAGSLGSSNSPVKIVVNPGKTGDVWVSTDVGLFHSTDNGSTFEAIDGITQAFAIALGAPAEDGGYPAVYAAANLGGFGYFRSDDVGANWVQINDAAHGFGNMGSNVITADATTFGRVYIGAGGRGIWYGDAEGAAPTPSSPASSTVAASTSTAAPSSTRAASTTVSRPASSTTAAPPTSTGVAAAWGQCGGIGYSGPTACASGSVCTVQNDYYSQCIPN